MSNYEKYRNRYLELKNKTKTISGGNLDSSNSLSSSLDYTNELKKLYPTCQFDKDRKESYEKANITYGEMNYEGFDKLLKYLKNDVNVFLDIGSGRGKLCLYAASFPFIKKSTGIEVVKERHNDALSLKKKLEKYSETKKVTFINDYVENVNLSQFKNDKILIWLSNLCMAENITNTIFENIAKNLPKGTIIGCSKAPQESPKYKKLTDLKIPMSWSEDSNIYLYVIL